MLPLHLGRFVSLTLGHPRPALLRNEPVQAQQTDTRLIEAGFPCHQVGAETRRERGASSSLPPLYFLHVWWARRPLAPSRAALIAALLPGDTDPDWFLRELGIAQAQALVNGEPWTLTEEKELKRIITEDEQEYFVVDRSAEAWLEQEQRRRRKNRDLIAGLIRKDAALASDPILVRWQQESQPLPSPLPVRGAKLPVRRPAADPAHVNERIAFARSDRIKKLLSRVLQWDRQDLYGYGRAFAHHPTPASRRFVILDPTAGGGSIPFEALRLGHEVIANELNPVATVILHATLDYPARFGPSLADDIQNWGRKLVEHVAKELADVTPFSPLPESERQALREHCQGCPEMVPLFEGPEYDQTALLYVRQVTCPHCGGEAPLLNSCWLSKQGEPWGVRAVPDGNARAGRVRFEMYRAHRKIGSDGRVVKFQNDQGKWLDKYEGPHGEDPDLAFVVGGEGTCVHCRQTIDAREIKAQARGESPRGKWTDRLYCVVAVRRQPRLDAQGKPPRTKGQEIKTENVSFFRPPNAADLDALARAEEKLKARREGWETDGIIPTERVPPGYETTIRWPLVPPPPGIAKAVDAPADSYGLEFWTDLFTPRQLLGHGTLVEQLRLLTPQLLRELGPERGKAVVTYLQIAIDKGLDYNSKQTRFHLSRGVLINTFARHDFSIKWSFGEMVFSGPRSAFAWCLSQVRDAYASIAALVLPLHRRLDGQAPPVLTLNGSAAHMPSLADRSVDLICMDPPYYNKVTYSELSDYFYVWQRRTLRALYPALFGRRLTDKANEAVANPFRDGSKQAAAARYEQMLGGIFAECRRVLRDEGRMVLLFTHKSPEAWEALTQALLQSGWTITASFPVESESAQSAHTRERASALSSLFLTCRKRPAGSEAPATWVGFGGTGVQQRIRAAVQDGLKEFEPLRLNPVDELVAAYGCALRVLSEQWPVLGEDDRPVSPVRALSEASRVVAQHQIARQSRKSLTGADCFS
jgi:adenine-specific DNA methylase